MVLTFFEETKSGNTHFSGIPAIFLTTEKEGFEIREDPTNPHGKEVWRDPICLVTQVVTQI